MSLSKSAKQKRGKLADILIGAGLDTWKVLDAVSFPACTGFNFNGMSVDRGASVSGTKFDDDFRLSYSLDGSAVKTDFPAANKKRNSTGDKKATYSYNEDSENTKNGKRSSKKNLFPGVTKITCDVFDGWAVQWKASPYNIEFSYSDGSQQSISAGRAFLGTSRDPLPDPQPPDYFDHPPKLNGGQGYYYPNGHAIIPPAKDWPMPINLTPKEPMIKKV